MLYWKILGMSPAEKWWGFKKKGFLKDLPWIEMCSCNEFDPGIKFSLLKRLLFLCINVAIYYLMIFFYLNSNLLSV